MTFNWCTRSLSDHFLLLSIFKKKIPGKKPRVYKLFPTFGDESSGDYFSGQIIATSHDLTPNGGLVKGNPLISGKSRLVKYYNLARFLFDVFFLPK